RLPRFVESTCHGEQDGEMTSCSRLDDRIVPELREQGLALTNCVGGRGRPVVERRREPADDRGLLVPVASLLRGREGMTKGVLRLAPSALERACKAQQTPGACEGAMVRGSKNPNRLAGEGSGLFGSVGIRPDPYVAAYDSEIGTNAVAKRPVASLDRS